MTERFDALLRRLPETPSADAAPVNPAELDALRRGALSETAAAALEARLARDPQGRAQLAELATPLPEGLVDWAVAHGPAPRRRRTGIWAGAALAAAALIAVAVVELGPTGDGPALPRYALDGPRGGVRITRSDDAAASTVFAPQTLLSLVLRPDESPGDPPPSIRLFAAPGGGRLLPVEGADIARGATGAVRIEGPAGRLLGATPGPYTLVVVVIRDAARLGDLAGRTLVEARTLVPEARWFAVDVELRADP